MVFNILNLFLLAFLFYLNYFLLFKIIIFCLAFHKIAHEHA